PMLQFACPRCKATLNADDSLRGTVYTCPHCQQALRLPGAPAGSPPPPPPSPWTANILATPPSPPPPAPPPEPFEPADFEPPTETAPVRPRGRRRRFSKRALLLSSGALAVLLIGVIAWRVFAAGPGVGDDIIYLPDNFDFVASVDVSEVLSSDAFQSLK